MSFSSSHVKKRNYVAVVKIRFFWQKTTLKQTWKSVHNCCHSTVLPILLINHGLYLNQKMHLIFGFLQNSSKNYLKQHYFGFFVVYRETIIYSHNLQGIWIFFTIFFILNFYVEHYAPEKVRAVFGPWPWWLVLRTVDASAYEERVLQDKEPSQPTSVLSLWSMPGNYELFIYYILLKDLGIRTLWQKTSAFS